MKSLFRKRPTLAYKMKVLKLAFTTVLLGFRARLPFQYRPITLNDVERILKKVKEKNVHSCMVFTDDASIVSALKNRKGIDVMYVNADKFDPPTHIDFAVYAVNRYYNGVNVLKWFFQEKVRYFSAGVDHPTSILSDDRNAENAIKGAWEQQIKEGWDKFDLQVGGDFENIFQLISSTRKIPGCYIEMGVYNGSSADVALRYMSNLGIERRCIFIDSFDSFNYEEAINSPDQVWIGTHTEANQQITTDRLKGYNSDKLQVEVRKANVCSPDFIDDVETICIANIDVDLFEAIVSAAEVVIPKLSIGGVLIVEDAGHGPALAGARYAVDKILEKNPKLLHLRQYSGQHFLIKTM